MDCGEIGFGVLWPAGAGCATQQEHITHARKRMADFMQHIVAPS
jgi:hypothetical protein